ncbi:M10 family metallopeptidase C-terminal domain-containing protein [Microvirga sp. 2MCAF38]|uniref:M10 family metallopeptidase C-terminal domain-containing protein n=1 Tax=Microvirga sp. 2MCAF38 TaxID=3232989 RepID=UPI003F9A0FE6
MAIPGSIAATGVQNIDALLSGYRWLASISALSYSFPDSKNDYETGYPEASALDFGAVSFDQIQAARYVLEGWSPYVGGPRMGMTSFEQVTNAIVYDAGFNGADVRIARSSDADPTAYAYLPMNDSWGGDLWFGTSHDYSFPVVGNYEYHTMIHELGHALGLKHGHTGGGVSDVALEPDYDSMEFSVMTYRSYVGQAVAEYTNGEFDFAQTFMMLDIAALQEMYGANYTTNAGPTIYKWDPQTGECFVNGVGQGKPGANRVFMTVWDGGGADTYDFSSYGDNLTIDLAPGSWCVLPLAQTAYLGNGTYARGSVFNALQYHGLSLSLIENAIGGSGNDLIEGNSGFNILSGGAGDDTLFGGGGVDTLDGGSGINTALFSGAKSDYKIFENYDGTFTVTDQRFDGDGAVTVKNIKFGQFRDQTFTFERNKAPTSVSLSNNTIYKDAPPGTIIGTIAGIDPNGDALTYSLIGDAQGLFRVDGDKLVLAKSLANEIVASHFIALWATDPSGAWTYNYVAIQTIAAPPLPPTPSLVLRGGSGSDQLTGDAGDDTIYGYGGNDVLYGGPGHDKLYGGSGKDTLAGGTEQDTFVFNTKLGSKTNVDRIIDFSVRDDSIWLENAIFRAVGKGSSSKPLVLSKSAFCVGTKAHDDTDRIIYNNKKGYLYYDADGSGEGAAVLFAILPKNLKLTYKDFYVI